MLRLPDQTTTLINDTLDHLITHSNISPADLFVLKNLIYGAYLEGVTDGIKKAQEVYK